MKRPPIVRVTWVDSGYQAGWASSPASTELMTIHSAGYLLKKNKKRLVITHSLHEGDRAMSPASIPACAVVKLEYL